MNTRPNKKQSKALTVSNSSEEPYEVDRSIDDLYAILNYMRPAGSTSEEEMIENFIIPLGAVEDDYGNYILRIDNDDGSRNPVLWSCHTDSVHFKDGKQQLYIDTRGVLSSNGGSCLGADDGAGIWLMRRMALAGKPGLYIFHREEEIGGFGSRHIANKSREFRKKKKILDAYNSSSFKPVDGKEDNVSEAKKYLEKYFETATDPLAGIKYAIAFDRKGFTSVITHQGARCCSDAFADSLALELSDGVINFKKDDGGTFTDTANYTDLIAECTNISVGYCAQHTRSETLDTVYIKRLLELLLAMDHRNLESKRNPDDPPEYKRYNYGVYRPTSANSNSYTLWDDDYEGNGTYAERTVYTADNEVRWAYHLVKDHTTIITDILEDLGFDYNTLAAEIRSRGGKIK